MSKILSYGAAAVVLSIISYDVLQDVLLPDLNSTTVPAVSAVLESSNTVAVEIPDYSAQLPQSLSTLNFAGLDSYRNKIQQLVDTKEFSAARNILLELAADAVRHGEQTDLGNSLALLGEISLHQRDLNAAENYLMEAVTIFEESNNLPGSAYAYLQLGKVHVTARQLARKAGESYDLLLIARNQIAKYRYDDALNNLQRVVESNLGIDRYGSAAAALQSLAILHRLQGQTQQSEQSLQRAAILYASAGQDKLARTLISQLSKAGVDPTVLNDALQEVEGLAEKFNTEMVQMRKAEDLLRLYNHYSASGNEERAWKFRLKASQAVAKTSRQAMYHRQPGVLAVLYNSNDNMALAKNYIDRADKLFSTAGLNDWQTKTQEMTRNIF
ncbi:MAG: tetratricopeptide (TPR) repeat protein [Parasphingorhabdus sp.]|jgi:tetratricopeptide (TPR) repeat protein